MPLRGQHNRGSVMAALAAVVVGSAASAAGSSTDGLVAADRHLNSYESDMAPGIHAGAGPISLADGARRLLVAELPDAVYVGGVRVERMDDLEEFGALLVTIARRRGSA